MLLFNKAAFCVVCFNGGYVFVIACSAAFDPTRVTSLRRYGSVEITTKHYYTPINLVQTGGPSPRPNSSLPFQEFFSDATVSLSLLLSSDAAGSIWEIFVIGAPFQPTARFGENVLGIQIFSFWRYGLFPAPGSVEKCITPSCFTPWNRCAKFSWKRHWTREKSQSTEVSIKNGFSNGEWMR